MARALSKPELDGVGIIFYPGYAHIVGHNFNNNITMMLNNKDIIKYQLVSSNKLLVDINSPFLENSSLFTFRYPGILDTYRVWKPMSVTSVTSVPLSGGKITINGYYFNDTKATMDDIPIPKVLQKKDMVIFNLPNNITKMLMVKEYNQLIIEDRDEIVKNYKFVNTTNIVFN